MDTLLPGATPADLFQASWVALNNPNGVNIVGALQSVAYVLFLFFITSQALQAATSGRGEQLRQLMLRALVAGALFMAAPWIQHSMVRGWVQVYAWSTTTAKALVKENGEAVRRGLQNIEEDAWSVGVIAAINRAMEQPPLSEAGQGGVEFGLIASSGAAAIGDAVARHSFNNPLARFGLASAARVLRVLILPVVAMFIVLIYGSGLIVLIGALFFPIATALVASGTGYRAVAQAISKVTAAYALLVAIPLIFMTVMNIAIYQPLIRVADGLQDSVKLWEALASKEDPGGKSALNLALQAILGLAGIPADFVLQNWEAIWTTVDKLFDTLVSGLLMALGGVIAAFFLMMQLESYLAGFLGGIATQAAGATRTQAGFSAAGAGVANAFKNMRGEYREEAKTKAAAKKGQEERERHARWESIWKGEHTSEPPPSNRG